MRTIAVVLALATAVLSVHGDVYLHHPKGSNDRNCERNVNRNNGNRLFDSQNNAKGGYACPRAATGPSLQTSKPYFYSGSKLPIEWTAQHGSGPYGTQKGNVVIQMACTETLDPAGAYNGGARTATQFEERVDRQWVGTPRDGFPRDSNDAATDTIPDNEAQAVANTVENRRFGMHETVAYYAKCKETERNKGLFTADQNLRRDDARATRENPNGNRNGLECPEERDYYPYWRPSPWMDVAVLHSWAPAGTTEFTEWCNWYKTNSQNAATSSVGECEENPNAANNNAQQLKNQGRWPNNRAACTALGHTWVAGKRFGMAPGTDLSALALTDVDCQALPASRVNHLGNAAGAVYRGGNDPATATTAAKTAEETALGDDLGTNRYVWTVPNMESSNCVLRIRYNLSTGDQPFMVKAAGTSDVRPGLTALNNTNNNQDNSPLKQDPTVDLDGTRSLSVALNTNQVARVFQDRTYVFEIRKPRAAAPAAAADKQQAVTARVQQNDAWALATQQRGGTIWNVGTRGKRGNIVQTFPAVEYDFVPNVLNIAEKDSVHFQFSGSDYNPQRGCNDAEGGPPDQTDGSGTGTLALNNQNARADRSNLVVTNAMDKNLPAKYTGDVLQNSPFLDQAGLASASAAMRMAYLDQEEQLAARFNVGCYTNDELDAINNNNARETATRNCNKLNGQATPYFDGQMWRIATGTTTFVSTRNNNHSNRDQSMVIVSSADPAAAKTNGMVGASKNTVRSTANPAATGETPRQEAIADTAFGITLPADAINQAAPQLPAATETRQMNVKDSDARGDGEKYPCTQLKNELDVFEEPSVIGLAVGMVFVGFFVLLVVQYVGAKHMASKAGMHSVGFLDYMLNAVTWRNNYGKGGEHMRALTTTDRETKGKGGSNPPPLPSAGAGATATASPVGRPGFGQPRPGTGRSMVPSSVPAPPAA